MPIELDVRRPINVKLQILNVRLGLGGAIDAPGPRGHSWSRPPAAGSCAESRVRGRHRRPGWAWPAGAGRIDVDPSRYRSTVAPPPGNRPGCPIPFG